MSKLNYTEKKVLRASAVLTGSYVAVTHGPQGGSTANDPVENSKFVLLIGFTKGSLDSMELKVEFSDDDSTYYQETNASGPVAGESTLTQNTYTIEASGNYVLDLDITTRYVKVSVIGTGTVTNSLLTLDSVLATRPV